MITETSGEQAADIVQAELEPVGYGLDQVPVDERLSEEARTRIRRSVPDGTRRAYAGDWKRVSGWGEATGRTVLPMSANTLAEYTTSLAAADYAPSTISRAMAAIATAHKAAGVAKPDTAMALAVLRDHRRQRAKAKKTQVRKAAPVTLSRLQKMVATCDCTTFKGLRNRALLVLGFATGARRAELVALDLPTDLIFTDEGLLIVIRESKTDHDSEGRVVAIPYGANPSTCPIRTVKALIEALEASPLAGPDGYSGPLFVRVDRHGVIGRASTGRGSGDGRLSDQAVALVVNDAARTAGFDPKDCWSGHSLRRGFATESYAAGANPLWIARHGGWVDGSKVLFGYVEQVDKWKDNPLRGVGL